MSEQKKRVLVVEDEKMLLDLVSGRLKQAGFDVLTAEDGEAGWEAIKNKKPDLVLLDIIMPKMDGYEVLEKMQEQKISIPVIIISNSGQPVEIEKTKKLGAVDHLLKTEFNPEEVVDKVKKAFGQLLDSGEVIASVTNPEVKQLGIKVILAEDDTFLREICVKKLVNEGFTVYPAVDGKEVVDSLEKIRPQIVLLDIIMPSIDGFQVLSDIRSRKDQELSKVPVIMLSNLGQEDDIKKAMAMGANDYLVKAHFTTEEIVEKIKALLKK